MLAALAHLAPLPSAALDRLLRETLDLASHRLDAWVTSLATERLSRMRASRPTGAHLGAYGVVRDLVSEAPPARVKPPGSPAGTRGRRADGQPGLPARAEPRPRRDRRRAAQRARRPRRRRGVRRHARFRARAARAGAAGRRAPGPVARRAAGLPARARAVRPRRADGDRQAARRRAAAHERAPPPAGASFETSRRATWSTGCASRATTSPCRRR